MIKVNLLREQADRPHKPLRVSAPTVSRTGIIALVVFLLAGAGLGTSWYYLNGQILSLTEKRDRLRIENARLQALKKQINEYEKLKKQVQGKIDVIERLKENQSSPVVLLNSVIQSIPKESSLWLTLLDQKGDRIQIVGFTPKADVIPDFITNLSTSGFFKSVDLETFEDMAEAAKFSLVCITKRKGAAE